MHGCSDGVCKESEGVHGGIGGVHGGRGGVDGGREGVCGDSVDVCGSSGGVCSTEDEVGDGRSCDEAAALHPVFQMGERMSDELDGVVDVLFTSLGRGRVLFVIKHDRSSLTWRVDLLMGVVFWRGGVASGS